jgi:glyoxylase-like metal-dependent hydrolase (beta-lactamase superfamily II)/ferredoxin
MARLRDRLPGNADGDFYVDRSCIDCGTCAALAPEVFAAGDGHHLVHRQPAGAAAERRAEMAIVACPTASIGTARKRDLRPAAGAFPERLEDDVWFLGYTARDSFGAWSWLIRRSEGNVMVDSPRAAEPLLRRIEALGGVALLVLTHRDDVADHESIARRFRCPRVMHEADVDQGTRKVERQVGGSEPIALARDLLLIPTPGHTPGHCVLLHDGRFLFSGDHLFASEDGGELEASREYCWHDWSEQIRSTERLLDHRFSWVLPGHGRVFRASSPASARAALERCLARMRRA